jgi:hypothetical protein
MTGLHLGLVFLFAVIGSLVLATIKYLEPLYQNGQKFDVGQFILDLLVSLTGGGAYTAAMSAYGANMNVVLACASAFFVAMGVNIGLITTFKIAHSLISPRGPPKP